MSAFLSPRMAEVLRHAESGRPLDTGIHGRSAYGGLSRTLSALRRVGLLDAKGCITDNGRAALAQQAHGGREVGE